MFASRRRAIPHPSPRWQRTASPPSSETTTVLSVITPSKSKTTESIAAGHSIGAFPDFGQHPLDELDVRLIVHLERAERVHLVHGARAPEPVRPSIAAVRADDIDRSVLAKLRRHVLLACALRRFVVDRLGLSQSPTRQ